MIRVDRTKVDVAENLAKLGLRLAVGLVIAWHGWQKIDGGVSNFADFVEFVDVPLSTLVAYIVTTIEFVGGILIALGLLTRIPAALLTLEMIGTGFYVKAISLDTGFISPEAAGFELDVLLLAGAAAITLMGAGRYSLDRLFGTELMAAYEVQPTMDARTPRTVDLTDEERAKLSVR